MKPGVHLVANSASRGIYRYVFCVDDEVTAPRLSQYQVRFAASRSGLDDKLDVLIENIFVKITREATLTFDPL
jgi:hypothetical protein